MLGSLVKGLKVPAISLGILVVSLVFVEAAVPVVNILSPVTQGLSSPLRVAIDGDGFIYVTDSAACGIQKINTYGQLVATYKTPVPPQGIAVTPDGNMITTQNDAVIILDKNGVQIGKLGQGAGQFKKANGITVDENGYIYVVDTGANSFQVFTPSGQFVRKIGALGSLAGQFNGPTGIAYNKATKEIVVADSFNARLQFFDTVNYVWKRTIGSLGSTALKFTSPQGISFEYITDPATGAITTRMYVVDAFQSCVQVIELGTTPIFLAFIGNYGYRSGQLVVPPDLVFDAANKRLIVANGDGYLTVYGIDGGSSPILDTTPPTLLVDQLPSMTDSLSITVSGSVESGAAVSLSADTAVTISAVSYTSSTTWYTVISGLAAGLNTITVTAKDVAGNTSSASVSTVYEIPAPALSVEQLAAYSGINTLLLQGEVEAGATVAVSTDSVSTVTVTYPTSTSWKAQVSGLADGPVTFTVTAKKPYSSVAVVSAATIIDTAAPAITVSALANGSFTSTQIQNVSGKVSDATLARIAINGEPVTFVDGVFSSAVNLVAGANTITVDAVDLVGNISSDSRTIVFDNTVPAITVSAPADGLYTNSTVATISGTVGEKVAPLSTVTVGEVPANISGFDWSAVISLKDGLNTIDIVATDLAGNSANAKRTITVDVAKPEVAITLPGQDIAISQPTLALSGTVGDVNGINVTAAINGNVVPVVVTGTTFSLSASFTTAGSYAVAVTAVDVAGNTATATRTVLYTPEQKVTEPGQPQPAGNGATVTVPATPPADQGAQVTLPVVVDGPSQNADEASKNRNIKAQSNPGYQRSVQSIGKKAFIVRGSSRKLPVIFKSKRTK